MQIPHGFNFLKGFAYPPLHYKYGGNKTGLQNTNNIQWQGDIFFAAATGVQNAIKVAQWYAVQEGDATMFIQGYIAWTKKLIRINFKLRKAGSSGFERNQTSKNQASLTSFINTCMVSLVF